MKKHKPQENPNEKNTNPKKTLMKKLKPQENLIFVIFLVFDWIVLFSWLAAWQLCWSML